MLVAPVTVATPSAAARRKRQISSINSRMTLARIVVSPPKPSPSYNDRNRSSVRRDAGSSMYSNVRSLTAARQGPALAGNGAQGLVRVRQ